MGRADRGHDERTYLFDLDRSSRKDSRTLPRRRDVEVLARYIFLDPGAQDFFVDWDAAGIATTALLRAEVGRDPRDRALRELVGDLSSLSPEFRGRWAAHDVLIRHNGVKRLRHPDVGHLELTFQSLDLPLSGRAVHDLIVCTAEPGTASEDRLKLLASWAVTQTRAAQPADHSPALGPL